MYSAGAQLVALVHFVFIALAVFGGFLIVLDPAWAWIQIPIVLWAGYVFLADRSCPLTPLEKSLHARAGRPAYQGGFVEHYLAARICPRGMTPRGSALIGAGILLWNGVVGIMAMQLTGQWEWR